VEVLLLLLSNVTVSARWWWQVEVWRVQGA
jgi:hypothetical protein